MAVVVYIFGFIELPLALLLCLQILLGMLLYLIFNLMLKNESLEYMPGPFKKLIKKRGADA